MLQPYLTHYRRGKKSIPKVGFEHRESDYKLKCNTQDLTSGLLHADPTSKPLGQRNIPLDWRPILDFDVNRQLNDVNRQ